LPKKILLGDAAAFPTPTALSEGVLSEGVLSEGIQILWASISTHFAVALNTFLSRNLDQNMTKSALIFE